MARSPHSSFVMTRLALNALAYSLVADGEFKAGEVLNRLIHGASKLPPDVIAVVVNQLHNAGV